MSRLFVSRVSRAGRWDLRMGVPLKRAGGGVVVVEGVGRAEKALFQGDEAI